MKRCENCEIEHDGTYASGRFCSLKCSRSFCTKRSNTDEGWKRLRRKSQNKNPDFVSLEIKCENCGEKFLTKSPKQRFCTQLCARKRNFRELGKAGGKKSAFSQNRRSKNEVYFAELCAQKFEIVKFNEPFFNGWDADVILIKEKIAILWNGKWLLS